MRFSTVLPFLFGIAILGPVYGDERTSLEIARELGAQKSKYHNANPAKETDEKPEANLKAFRKDIQPLLRQACVKCHGPDSQKADFRVDTLDPNLLTGGDLSWWLEVIDVVSNGEMPPAEDDAKLSDSGRAAIVEWLSQELKVASDFRRSEGGHTSFRRLTRYEYNYALEDLLGMAFDFSEELPPESASEDGFKNSSEMLQMSVMQFEQYRELGLKALEKATVRGERPAEAYFAIDFADQAKAATEVRDKATTDTSTNQTKKKKQPKPVSVRSPHLIDEKGQLVSNLSSNLRGRTYASVETQPEIPAPSRAGMVLTSRGKVALTLGPNLPDEGHLRVRIRASKNPDHEGTPPRLRLFFGFQASNNSHANGQVSETDLVIEAFPDQPEIYEFLIPISETLERNPFRGKRVTKVNSNESLILQNATSQSDAWALIDYVEVTTPAYDQWPPRSHRRVFKTDSTSNGAVANVRGLLKRFMRKAWRREILDSEVDQKVALYDRIRPGAQDDQSAMIEVLSNVLASPNFLYVVQSSKPDQNELATRLAMFLWSSLPDNELLDLAAKQELNQTAVLLTQVDRMLKDPRAERFSRHFVRQWLGMDLLDYLKVDGKVYKGFDTELKESMQEEPIAFFKETLSQNESILNFLHADFAMVNERLAKHYGIPSDAVQWNGQFERVALSQSDRGGLLTQAGLLAMNSDGKDSHPLKRGIWLLERILNDPPPPPPPSVPEIDLADPEILKLTLKERMEDHRNDPACMSCHQRIDPWGIVFENYDAIGSWRDTINNDPIDASATLFNQERLAGIEGLKEYLLLNRQDQFAEALVHKLCVYALGRPMAFSDRSDIGAITSQLRKDGDGLATLISHLVTSDLFRIQ